MDIIISDGSNRYVTVVDCPKEISEKFYDYLNAYIDSPQYKHSWGAEELIRYINRIKPKKLEDLKIKELYTDRYDEDAPKFSI